jgi:hypothetical protein
MASTQIFNRFQNVKKNLTLQKTIELKELMLDTVVKGLIYREQFLESPDFQSANIFHEVMKLLQDEFRAYGGGYGSSEDFCVKLVYTLMIECSKTKVSAGKLMGMADSLLEINQFLTKEASKHGLAKNNIPALKSYKSLKDYHFDWAYETNKESVSSEALDIA